MPLNDVSFVIKKGGLNRVAASQDGVSAMYFDADPPDGFGTNNIKSYTSLSDLEADGVQETAAGYALAWYQCAEFWRIAPGQKLYVSFHGTFNELRALSNGEVRLIGYMMPELETVESEAQPLANQWAAAHAPVQVIIGLAPESPIDLSLVDDASLFNCPNVSVLLFGSDSDKATALADSLGLNYIPALGAVLGAVALARVNESVAWVSKFNLSNGVELEGIRLADGNLPTDSLLNALNDKRYIVARKHVGVGGTYLNDSHTATTATDDFAYIETNRVVQKARRLVRAAMLPQLGSPISVDADTGRLSPARIAELEGICEQALQTMLQGVEVSGLDIYINPNQNVLSTGVLGIDLRIVPVGVARNIVVTIGLVLKLSA